MNISIRKAEIEDSESISKLSGQLGYNSEKDSIHIRMTAILNSSDNFIFVAIADEKVVGWIHAFYTLRVESGPFMEIGGLVVEENYRKDGVGKLLVEKILQLPESLKCNKVRVRCNTIRKESHIFYEKIGFELNKEQKVFDKEIEAKILNLIAQ